MTMRFPRLARAALFPALLLAAGCAKAPPPDIAPFVSDYERVRAEALSFGPDSLGTAFLEAAATDRAMADRLAEEEAFEGSVLATRSATALARVALASALAARRTGQAEDCLQQAADARREWQDAVHLLEQAEKVAGREARGIVREAEPGTASVESPAAIDVHVALTEADAGALLERRGALKATAADAGVAVSDLESIWAAELAAAGDPERPAAVRSLHRALAARAVQELGFRLRAEHAVDRCRQALELARVYAGYRDQALWAMVELERGMKETVRQELDQERSRMQDRQQELYDALQQFEGKFASIRQEARGTIMSLSDILFDFDKATLKRDAEFNLVRVATIFQQFPEMHIYIEGHTDNIGTEEYNQKLSERRALAVFNFLAEQGVSQERMDWFGYGMSQPVAPNSTEEGRAKNRRVDLVIGE